jgi:hypothetical protein
MDDADVVGKDLATTVTTLAELSWLSRKGLRSHV